MADHAKHRYFFTGKSLVTYQYEVYADTEAEARRKAYFGPAADEKIVSTSSEDDIDDLKLIYTDDWDEKDRKWVGNPKHVCARCGGELPFPEDHGEYWCKADLVNLHPLVKITPARDMSMYMENPGAEFCPKCVQWLYDKILEVIEAAQEEKDG